MLLSFIIPTHNRPRHLAATLDALGRLGAPDFDCERMPEVVVVDNASDERPSVPRRLANGIAATRLELNENTGAAARNIGADAACGAWLVMLDDDSHPLDLGFVRLLREASPEVAAIGADIVLPGASREAGGLPEVFIGCGVAIRTDVFRTLGGYDASFGYYAEEYDLAARMLLAGYRVEHDARFRVRHMKTAAGRDFSAIVGNLVRNNGWVWQRYAPAEVRRRYVREILRRYGRIARREGAMAGWRRGGRELLATISAQPCTPMSQPLFDRFTGRAAVRAHLCDEPRLFQGRRTCVVDRGKHDRVVQEVLAEVGAALVPTPDEADAVVIGTLSPGPMLDAAERWEEQGVEVVVPWMPRGVAPRIVAAR